MKSDLLLKHEEPYLDGIEMTKKMNSITRLILFTRLNYRFLILGLSFLSACLGILSPYFQKNFIDLLVYRKTFIPDFFHIDSPLWLIFIAAVCLWVSQSLNQLTQFLALKESLFMQKKLAEMITEITKAQLLTFRLGQLKNEHRATPAQISMAKRNNVNMALQIAREARQIHGGMGITGEYPIMRHMMNLESVITYEGTHDIHLLITGMDVTGFNAFS